MISILKEMHYSMRCVFLFIFSMLIVSTSIPIGWGPLNWFDSLWPVLAAMVAVLYFPARWEGILDAEAIEDGKRINHFLSAVLRIVGIVGVAFLYHAHFMHLSLVLVLSIFGVCWYGLVFNYTINVERDKPAFYLPKKDEKYGSWMDKIFNNLKYGGEIIAIGEVLLMFLSGYVYVNQY